MLYGMPATESVAVDTAATRRRWFQFSLRTMFVLMTVVGALCGWLGLRIRHGWEQRRAVLAIKELGGSVGFAAPSTWWQRSKRLRDLFGDEVLLDVREVNLNMVPVDDAGLAHIAGFTQLVELRLNSSMVTDAGLAHLSALRDIEFLDLANTSISGSGFRHCGRLTKLEILAVNGTRLNDLGASYLRDKTELRRLYVYGTPITDQGILHLQRLRALESLVLTGTQVSDEGLERIRRVLPDTNVYRDDFRF